MQKLIGFIFALVVIFSCNSQKVTIDYDRNVNFSHIKTYRIDETVQNGLNDLDKERLYTALEQNFRFRGVTKSDVADVDLRIYPSEYVTNKTNSSVGIGLGSFGSSIGGGLSVGVPISSKKLNQEYVVSMYQNNKMIWEGILVLEMPLNASADVKQESINKGVAKLLNNYPPKGN